jgi:hypothetical protein
MNHERITKRFCTFSEAADILGTDQQAVLEMIQAGELQEVQVKHCTDRLIPRPLVECLSGGIKIES